MNELISVIVPVYNVENYLDRCLESIVKQTYKNLEILLVDDGSTDRSSQICDEWAKKDSRIKVIHKPNGGLSDARNAGINIARGAFIGFVDSDDVIDETMYEKLYKSITQQNAHMSIGRMCMFDENDKKVKINETSFNKICNNNILNYYVLIDRIELDTEVQTENIMGSVCRALYKKQFIGEHRFIKDLFCEDIVFNSTIIDSKTKIATVDEYLYFYFQRSGSILHSFNEKMIKKRLIFTKQIIETLSSKIDNQLLSAYKFNLFRCILVDLAKCEDKKLFKKYKHEIYSLNLNTKENYKNCQSQIKSLKNKLINYLVRRNNVGLLRLMLKLKH